MNIPDEINHEEHYKIDKMKYENLKMIGILIYDWMASAYWWAAWHTPFGNKEESTRVWIKARKLKADWCANHVYHGSEWHGLHCEVDGMEAVVQVTMIETNQTNTK